MGEQERHFFEPWYNNQEFDVGIEVEGSKHTITGCSSNIHE